MKRKLTDVKRVVICVALAFVIVALGVAAVMLPRRSVAAGAASAELDAEALGVLSQCSAYAAGHDFDTEMTGSIKARVFSLPFSQNARGGRKVCAGCVTDTAESVSAFVKAAYKKECTGGKYTVARGEYKNGAFVYAEPTVFDRNEFVSAYGLPPTGLVKYDIENAVIGAVKDGDNAYRFTLDARRATAHCKNEVRTVLGASADPEYESIEFTLKTDGMRATEITSTEKFSVNKFGGVNVTAQYTEKFIYN